MSTTGSTQEQLEQGRPIRRSFMLLIGLPVLVALTIQGVIAVLGGERYKAEIAKVVIEAPEAAPPMQANVAELDATGKVMGPASMIALGLSLWIAVVAGRRFGERFQHLTEATKRIAQGDLDQKIELTHDAEFDPLAKELDGLRGKLRERLDLEVEQAELAKALELGAEVQRMLIPSKASLKHSRLEVDFFYRAATTCSGDFWISHEDPNGRLLVFVGDVTGHGSESAIVTASVAAQIRMHLARAPLSDAATLLTKLNESVLDLCGGAYRMTMAALEMNAERTSIRYHSAGAPPLIISDKSGRIDTVTVSGTPLGSPRFSVGMAERTLTPGARVHLFTDGIVEAERADGRAYGLRRLAKEFAAITSAPLGRVCEHMLMELDMFAAGAPQEDDWTMVVLEVA